MQRQAAYLMPSFISPMDERGWAAFREAGKAKGFLDSNDDFNAWCTYVVETSGLPTARTR